MGFGEKSGEKNLFLLRQFYLHLRRLVYLNSESEEMQGLKQEVKKQIFDLQNLDEEQILKEGEIDFILLQFLLSREIFFELQENLYESKEIMEKLILLKMR